MAADSGDVTVILGPDDPDRGDLALGDWMLEVSDELKRIAAEADKRDFTPFSRELRDWVDRLEGLHAWAPRPTTTRRDDMRPTNDKETI